MLAPGCEVDWGCKSGPHPPSFHFSFPTTRRQAHTRRARWPAVGKQRRGLMARLSSVLVLFACVAVNASLTLHAYEHCQFCTRTRLVLGWAGVSYTPKFYGYGDGADPEKNGGFGGSPKFPRVPGLLFLMRSADERAPEMVWQTL